MRLAMPVAALLLAISSQHDAAAQSFAEAGPGVEYAAMAARMGDAEVRAHVIRVALDRAELRILDARRPGRRAARVENMRQEAEAVAAVNASYFLADYTPLGLLVSQGRPMGPMRKADWGVFYVLDSKPGMVHQRDYGFAPGVTFAVEAGPRLVAEGKPITGLRPGRARRTAIGCDKKGRVYLVVTEGAAATSELAAFMAARPPSGLGCVSALNLDGGSSSQLSIDGGGVSASVQGTGAVPIAIGVYVTNGGPK